MRVDHALALALPLSGVAILYSILSLVLSLINKDNNNKPWIFFLGGELAVVGWFAQDWQLKSIRQVENVGTHLTNWSSWVGFLIGLMKVQHLISIDEETRVHRLRMLLVYTLLLSVLYAVLVVEQQRRRRDNATSTTPSTTFQHQCAKYLSFIVGLIMIVTQVAVLKVTLFASGPLDLVETFVWTGFGYKYDLRMLDDDDIVNHSLCYILLQLTICPLATMGLCCALFCFSSDTMTRRQSVTMLVSTPLYLIAANLLSAVLFFRDNELYVHTTIAHVLLLLQANAITILCGALAIAIDNDDDEGKGDATEKAKKE